MKKVLWALSLALTVGFTSCSSDDNSGNNEQNELENAFLFRGEEYSLKASYIEYWGEEAPGVFTWDVNLATSNFSFENDGDSVVFEDDIVSFFIFELNVSTPSGLQVGVYDIDEDNFSPFKCSYADFDYNCDTSNPELDFDEACEAFFELASGTVEIVSFSTTNITIKVDAMTEGGEAVEAHYSGSFLMGDEFEDRPSNQISKSPKQKTRR